MKNNIYILLVLFLMVGITSCNKEEITIDDPIITIDPPSEVDYPVAKGYVKGMVGSLSDVKVLVYQKGILIGETSSNMNGEYSTIDIETTPGQDLILEFSKEEYLSSYRKKTEEFLKTSTLDVELVINNGEDVSPPPIFKGITEYISLSGHVKDVQNEPIFAKYNAFMEAPYNDNGDQGIYSVSYIGSTDSDGYYELVLPKDAYDLKVAIYNDLYCFEYLTEPEVELPTSIQAEYMGPFTSDVVLGDYTSLYTSAPSLDLSGQVSTCDGLAIASANVFVFIKDNDGNIVENNLLTEADGTFSYTNDECVELPYTVQLVGQDVFGNMDSDTTTIIVSTSAFSDDSIVLQTCNTTIGGYSSAVMTVGGTEYTFNQITVNSENGDLVSVQGSSPSNATFTIPNIQLGTNNTILNLEMLDWGSGASFSAVNSTMPANVTALSANGATVSVTGDFNFNGGIVQGTCILNLIF